MPQLWLFALLILMPLVSSAAAPAWKIVPTESDITFTATQNDAPVTGKFTNFNGVIHFDPNHPADSNVKLIIDIGSLTDPNKQITATLKSSDWFNMKLFPQAIFQSDSFVKVGDKTFKAPGKLTIRDKTVPVTLTFTAEEYTQTKARMKGSATIKRTAFGVGQGEWSDTKNIKDDVLIDFTVTGIKK